jgi:hypothetical protein
MPVAAEGAPIKKARCQSGPSLGKQAYLNNKEICIGKGICKRKAVYACQVSGHLSASSISPIRIIKKLSVAHVGIKYQDVGICQTS